MSLSYCGDVAVDISHLNGLLGLNQVSSSKSSSSRYFLDITSRAGQLLNHALICLKRGFEIDDGLFNSMKLNQFFISRGFVQLALNLLLRSEPGAVRYSSALW